MSEEKTKIVLFVYVGSRISQADKLMDLWLQVTEDEFASGTLPTGENKQDRYHSWQGKATRRYLRGTPGTTYAVPTNGKSGGF